MCARKGKKQIPAAHSDASLHEELDHKQMSPQPEQPNDLESKENTSLPTSECTRTAENVSRFSIC